MCYSLFHNPMGRHFTDGYFCKHDAFVNRKMWYTLQMCLNKQCRCYNTTLLRTSHVTSNSLYSHVSRGNPRRVAGHGRIAIWAICPKLILHSNLAKYRSFTTPIQSLNRFKKLAQNATVILRYPEQNSKNNFTRHDQTRFQEIWF